MVQEVERYRKPTRVLHWVHAGAFVLLFLTGLVLFVPPLGILAQDSWTRLIHRIAAIVFVVAPLIYMPMNWKATLQGVKEAFTWGKEDMGWLKAAPRYYFLSDEKSMPPQGHMNTGQKMWWFMAIVFGIAFVLTGLIMWFFKELAPVALLQWMVFLHDTSRSSVGIELDGSVVVRCGVQDLGGGQASSLAHIAAEVLGVPMGDVRVYIADTALTPLAGTTTATRQLYMSGNATLKAARVVKKRLLEKAAEILEVIPDDLVFEDRRVFVEKEPDRKIFLKDLVKVCASQGIPLFKVAQFNAPARELIDFKKGQGQVFPDFTFGTHAAEVAVDVETGKVRVIKLVACFDVGKAINPLSVEGQLEGGTIQGMGYALMEDVLLEKGNTLTPSLSEYLIPTSLDVADVKCIMLESGDGIGPFGAKGIGEPAMVSAAPAIVNAVCDSIGVRVFELPVTPEKIVKAINRSL